MNKLLDLEGFKFRLALDSWLEDCRRRMSLRYPRIDFDSDAWPLRTLHDTDMKDWSFTESMADFARKDRSFADALRCVAAELVLAERPKRLQDQIQAFRLMRAVDAESLFDLDLAALRKIEDAVVKRARTHQNSARGGVGDLDRLSRHLDRLSARGVLPRIRFDMKRESRAELATIEKAHLERWRQAKADQLDGRIEALSEAFNALFANDPRLSPMDRVAIALLGLEMCAPSRVNEMLCLSIDDYVTIDDYTRRADGKELDRLHSAHQMLLVTMKGSKGANWSAKPVLNFMIDLFHYCFGVVKEHGKRSRMLVEWYQKSPDRLYLPPELEHLRGQDVSFPDLSKIMNLGGQDCRTSRRSTRVFNILRDKVFKAPKPPGRKGSAEIPYIRWGDIETHLLERVRQAMAYCRKVTMNNYYKGDLAKMLFLYDQDQSPYLPGSAKYDSIVRRLKQRGVDRKRVIPPTLFENLGITMPVDGRIQNAEIETHDPRRWLTTKALKHGEKLSDVLINKWANRLSLAQLKNYDFNTPEVKAQLSVMPDAHELKDLSDGLITSRKLEEEFGLKMDIVTVHYAGISATTMDAVAAAVEDRPIAKISEQIIILYPSWFGVCLHQHHETPCRSYTSCLPCDNNHVVKGHLPTNDHIRERKDLLHRSIVQQLEQLVIIHNRGIADDQGALARHVLALAERGLDAEQMADRLIAEFHEIKHLIKDACFANKLHEAFVARGFVQRLDAPSISSGAMMKYHNPTHHAAPGLERALDAHGGREQIERDRLTVAEKYPQFAPQSLGLKDQRSLIAPNVDSEDEDE